MKTFRTILLASAGIAGGMLIANYLTGGAVFEAAGNIISNVRGRISEKAEDITETAVDATANVIDAAADTASSVADSL